MHAHVYSYSSLLPGVAAVSFLTYWYEEVLGVSYVHMVVSDRGRGLYSSIIFR